MKYFKYNPIFMFVMIEILITDNVMGHRCYVCGDTDDRINCHTFDPSKQEYIKECPPRSKACSIQTYGDDTVIRSCETTKLNDCKIANNVRYCYCSKNLCNGLTNKFFTISDDEDIDDLEGSGMKTYLETNTVKVTDEVTRQKSINVTAKSIATSYLKKNINFFSVMLLYRITKLLQY